MSLTKVGCSQKCVFNQLPIKGIRQIIIASYIHMVHTGFRSFYIRVGLLHTPGRVKWDKCDVG